VDILSEEQYDVLVFVAACNRNFYNPTSEQVELWRVNREPADAVYKTTRRKVADGVPGALALQIGTATDRMIASMVAGPAFASMAQALTSSIAGLGLGTPPRYATERELVTPAESVLEHLLRLTWLTTATGHLGPEVGLRLSDLGQALLQDAERGETEQEDVSVVVLGREDPLAYAQVMGQFAAAGAGLLVDPYLKLNDLHTILLSTRLTRLLVSGKHNEREIGALRTYLASGSLSRRIEVRSSMKLHDRVLLADEGDVLTIGTSLNGVGRTTTVMTPIPTPAREALAEEYARLWEEADLVGPEPVVQVEAKDPQPDEGLDQ